MGWEIVLVPEKPPVFFQESTVDVVASNVEPKLANTLVRKLCQAAPLENLRHVKRVRRRAFEGKNELCIILCPAFGGENQLEGIPDDVQSLIDDYQLRPFIAKVAKYAASSKEEWEDQCKVWPTSYHPMIKADSVTEFTSEDSQWIVRCMKAALSLAKLRQLSQEVVNAALIVDPSSRELVAWAIDQTSSELSTNNIMEGSSCTRDAELLSFSESDENDVEYYQTLFHLYNSQEFSQSCVGVSCLFPRRWLEQKHHNEETTVNQGSKHSWHPLRHAAMVAIEKAADRDRQLFPNPSHLENSPNFGNSLQNSLISFPTKRQKTQMAEVSLFLTCHV
uniref:tRNA-specific adenosine deaminase-like protein 3 n=1 Tax=Anthurium amnicola TaxID=1678845 RepID=A0A1D1XVS7_9ARAE